MTDEELIWIDALEASRLIRAREISSAELMDATLGQLERTEPQVNAFVTVVADQARGAAAQADARLAAGGADDLPVFFGIPVSIKDLSETAGVRTTMGSRDYAEHVPAEDSVAVARVRASGAILFGKTTTPEFGMLGDTESALTGVTNNPWNVDYLSGGSSGGAAAATAAGVGAIAWGSDGGGSIRIPASICGVVGFKPSRGRIPNPMGHDPAGTDGPIARSVADVAALFSATHGAHRTDPYSIPSEGTDYLAAVQTPGDLKGKKIAFAVSPDGGRVAAEVADVVGAAVARFEEAGAIVEAVEIGLPDPVDYFLSFWGPGFAALQMIAELPHPAMRALAQRAGGADDYFRATTIVRPEINRAYERVFAEYDFIVTPTLPVAPFLHPGALGGNADIDGAPVEVPAIDFHRFTESPTHAGLPAITVPAGFSAAGLPIGMQLIGDHLDDVGVLTLAARWEEIAPWRDHRPSLA